MDGAVIFHSLPTSSVSKFHMYADEVFITYLERQLHTATMLDLVWDSYILTV